MSIRHRAVRARPLSYSRALRFVVCVAPLMVAGGCNTFPTLETYPVRPSTQAQATDSSSPIGGVSTDIPDERSSTVLRIPGGNAGAQTARMPATEEQIAALVPDELVDAALAPQPIAQFAATVFGNLLNVPFSLSGGVASRNEIIAGGTGGSISKRALFRMTQQALQQYGINVYIDGQTVMVGTPDASGIGAEVRRSRASPQTGTRVVQFFPVQTIEVNVLQSLLTDLFPNLGGARITPDPLTNSLLISGPGSEVAQVVRVLREIDQPRFAGAQVLRVEPVFWTPDTLAASLEQVLTTEGYVVSRQAIAGRSLVILSFPAANQVLIFSQDQALLDRARFWAENLDRPAARGDAASTFVYQVRNTDAQSLGQLAMGQSPTAVQAAPPVGVPGTAPAMNQSSQTAAASPAGGSGQFMNGRVLVDPGGNRIVFIGAATEFAQLRSLLQTLDTRAPQVVIEVMIAEVTLTDKTALGINFQGTDVRGDGTFSGGTEGITLGSGGLLATFVGPEFRARLNAEASNDRVNILQRPQLVVRSGGTARFQVGTDVPVITSQRATDSSSGGNGTDILQSVQYRQTGVILELTPVIYGDRVDIMISQENSSAGASPPGIASPTILNRSLNTQIAITDGWTGVLGGLISNDYSKVNFGVPFLKDIPVIGSAFQNNTIEGRRTELLVMITPTIIRGDEDMADFADRYASDMNSAFRTGSGWSYTLTPITLGAGIRGVGMALPTPSRPSDRIRNQSARDAQQAFDVD